MGLHVVISVDSTPSPLPLPYAAGTLRSPPEGGEPASVGRDRRHALATTCWIELTGAKSLPLQ